MQPVTTTAITGSHCSEPCSVSEPAPPPFTLHILSRRAGKPAIAEVANALLRRRSAAPSLKDGGQSLATSEAEISSLLEGYALIPHLDLPRSYAPLGDNGFPEPDLMLVHHIHPNPTSDLLDLHGFPPWQIRLTEFG